MDVKNKVVLFYPKPYFKQRLPWSSALVPLPIMALAAPLLAEGYDVTMINGDADADAVKNVVDNCFDALLLGISSMSGPQIFHGLEAAKAVRLAGHELPIIWGGYHPSILPEQTCKNKYVDAVVRGQGERTLLEIAGLLSQGEDFADVAGTTIQRQGEVISNPSRKMEDINNFPRLPYEKLDHPERYISGLPNAGKRAINYVSSQGCPYRCQFCAEPLVYGRRWLSYSPDRVMSDVEFLKSHFHLDGVAYVDANFFVKEHRSREIAQLSTDRGLDLKWTAYARSNQIVKFSEESIQTFKSSGLSDLSVGAESGSDNMLNVMQKDISREETIEAARIARRHGFHVSFFFIVGFPGETAEEVEETWDMIQQISEITGEYRSAMFFFAPMPGHALYEKACDMGFQQPATFEEWSQFNSFECNLPWVSQKFANRMKQRDFYLTFGYPSASVLAHSKGRRLRRRYVDMMEKVSSYRCQKKYWQMPAEWWVVESLKRIKDD